MLFAFFYISPRYKPPSDVINRTLMGDSPSHLVWDASSNMTKYSTCYFYWSFFQISRLWFVYDTHSRSPITFLVEVEFECLVSIGFVLYPNRNSQSFRHSFRVIASTFCSFTYRCMSTSTASSVMVRSIRIWQIV